MPKHVILFLAANPRGTTQLQLGEECAQIQRELKMAPHRDDFDFQSRWAVGIDDLMRHLMELEPAVIHFSGHGGGSAGLVLQDEQGQPQTIPARALAMMVESAACKPRVVVLNACYSTVQADALRAKADCVVGMDGAIGDDAARTFAVRFYGALGNRRSIGNAVAQGVAALAAKQLPDEVLPRYATRDGVGAREVFLDRSLPRPYHVLKDNVEQSRILYTWLHVSDIHLGDGDASHRAHQRTVLDGMCKDICGVAQDNDLQVQAIFVTGDIAFGSAVGRHGPDLEDCEYKRAHAWLHSLAHDLGVRQEMIFVVPGNHDVDRVTDSLPDVGNLVARLRSNARSLDTALSVPSGQALISRRLKRYLDFERHLSGRSADNKKTSRLYWKECIPLSGGIRLRLVGLNTALLAAGDDDRGKLAIGMLQIAETLMELQDNEVIIVLSHHPVTDGWLADEQTAAPFIFSRAHIHLSGHIHTANAEHYRGGVGREHIRISAGTTRAERATSGVLSGHGYNIGCIVASRNGETSLRIWPRRWSNRSAVFVPDNENIGPGQFFVEHPFVIGRRRSTRSGPARFKLAVIHGENKGIEIELPSGTYLLGRSRNALFELPHDGRTSREHASLLVTPSAVFIQDESQHGTWVNGVRLSKFEPVTLEYNATIQIGGSLLCVIAALQDDIVVT